MCGHLDGRVLGFAGAKHQTVLDLPLLNLYFRFAPESWGHGYATEAVNAVIRDMQSRHPTIPVLARVAVNNPRSLQVAMRAGLQRQTATDPADPVPHHLYSSAPLT